MVDLEVVDELIRTEVPKRESLLSSAVEPTPEIMQLLIDSGLKDNGNVALKRALRANAAKKAGPPYKNLVRFAEE